MARQKLIRKRHARSGLYIDFEGRAVQGEAPVLLGVLFASRAHEEDSELILRQFVFDESCAIVERVAGAGCEETTLDEAIGWLLDLSDSEERPVISWSLYDWTWLKHLSRDRSFRFRNAIATAKRWRRRMGTEGGASGNALGQIEHLVGYQRPVEQFGVAESIAYIRDRTTASPGSVERWRALVEHNEHDLRAMRQVVLHSVELLP
jgi:hypothetical protein